MNEWILMILVHGWDSLRQAWLLLKELAQLYLIPKSDKHAFCAFSNHTTDHVLRDGGREEAPGPPSVVAFHASIIMCIFLASLSSQLQIDLPLPWAVGCVSPFHVNVRRDVAKCFAEIKIPFFCYNIFQVYKIYSLEDAGWRVLGNSLYYTCNFLWV